MMCSVCLVWMILRFKIVGDGDMFLRLGNLTVKEFEKLVGTEFTEDELNVLESHRTDDASFSDQSKFHIFKDPAVSISIGVGAMASTVSVWKEANDRKPFNRPISFYPISE